MALFEDLAAGVKQLQPAALAGVAVASSLIYFASLVIYRLYFHPLAKYPGPFLWRISDWPAAYMAYSGKRFKYIHNAHQKYGEYVRIQPNLLCINNTTALRDIYGAGKNVMKPNGFYQMFPPGADEIDVFTETDKKEHARKRRVCAPLYTEAAIKEQELLFQKHIRRFCDMLGSNKAINIGEWANYLTFDVMGELAWGENFDMLGTEHLRFIPELLAGLSLRNYTLANAPFLLKLEYLGLLKPFIPQRIFELKDKLDSYYYAVLEKRKVVETKIPMYEVFRNSKYYQGQYTNNQMMSERLLLVAGSDTTALQIAANFYYLTQNPKTMERLTNEIRTRFKSADEITMGPKLDGCTYLRAVCDETIRISPSVPGANPRVVMKGGLTADGNYFPEGVNLCCPMYAMQHYEKYYPNPEKHIPERWLPEDAGTESVALARSALHPFSYGPRACIAQRLAWVELYCTMARTLYIYDVKYISGGHAKGGKPGDEYDLNAHMTADRHGPVLEFVERSDLYT